MWIVGFFSQNKYVKTGNEINKNILTLENLQLSLLGRISVIKMNILPRMMFLFQIIPILTTHVPFKQWQKDIRRFVWQGRKSRVKCKIFQNTKKQDYIYSILQAAAWIEWRFGAGEGELYWNYSTSSRQCIHSATFRSFLEDILILQVHRFNGLKEESQGSNQSSL